jgi:hypothetical protein
VAAVFGFLRLDTAVPFLKQSVSNKMINHNEALVEYMAAAVNDVALLFAGEPDDAVVSSLRAMRKKLNSGLGTSPEGAALTQRLMECVLLQRHHLQIGCSVASRTVH